MQGVMAGEGSSMAAFLELPSHTPALLALVEEAVGVTRPPSVVMSQRVVSPPEGTVASSPRSGLRALPRGRSRRMAHEQEAKTVARGARAALMQQVKLVAEARQEVLRHRAHRSGIPWRPDATSVDPSHVLAHGFKDSAPAQFCERHGGTQRVALLLRQASARSVPGGESASVVTAPTVAPRRLASFRSSGVRREGIPTAFERFVGPVREKMLQGGMETTGRRPPRLDIPDGCPLCRAEAADAPRRPTPPADTHVPPMLWGKELGWQRNPREWAQDHVEFLSQEGAPEQPRGGSPTEEGGTPGDASPPPGQGGGGIHLFGSHPGLGRQFRSTPATKAKRSPRPFGVPASSHSSEVLFATSVRRPPGNGPWGIHKPVPPSKPKQARVAYADGAAKGTFRRLVQASDPGVVELPSEERPPLMTRRETMRGSTSGRKLWMITVNKVDYMSALRRMGLLPDREGYTLEELDSASIGAMRDSHTLFSILENMQREEAATKVDEVRPAEVPAPAAAVVEVTEKVVLRPPAGTPQPPETAPVEPSPSPPAVSIVSEEGPALPPTPKSGKSSPWSGRRRDPSGRLRLPDSPLSLASSSKSPLLSPHGPGSPLKRQVALPDDSQWLSWQSPEASKLEAEAERRRAAVAANATSHSLQRKDAPPSPIRTPPPATAAFPSSAGPMSPSLFNDPLSNNVTPLGSPKVVTPSTEGFDRVHDLVGSAERLTKELAEMKARLLKKASALAAMQTVSAPSSPAAAPTHDSRGTDSARNAAPPGQVTTEIDVDRPVSRWSTPSASPTFGVEDRAVGGEPATGSGHVDGGIAAVSPGRGLEPQRSPIASPAGSPIGSRVSPPVDPRATSPAASRGSSPAASRGSSPVASRAPSPAASPQSSPAGSPAASPQPSPAASPAGSPTPSPAGSPTSSPARSPAASPTGSRLASPLSTGPPPPHPSPPSATRRTVIPKLSPPSGTGSGGVAIAAPGAKVEKARLQLHVYNPRSATRGPMSPLAVVTVAGGPKPATSPELPPEDRAASNLALVPPPTNVPWSPTKEVAASEHKPQKPTRKPPTSKPTSRKPPTRKPPARKPAQSRKRGPLPAPPAGQADRRQYRRLLMGIASKGSSEHLLGGFRSPDMVPLSAQLDLRRSADSVTKQFGFTPGDMKRLEAAWTSLDMPNEQRVYLLEKYRRPPFDHVAARALPMWGLATGAVTLREDLLEQLAARMRAAADPQALLDHLAEAEYDMITHHANPNVSRGLPDGAHASSLVHRLAAATLACVEFCSELLEKFGDVVSYKRRVYLEKLQVDYAETLFAVMATRLAEPPKAAIPVRRQSPSTMGLFASGDSMASRPRLPAGLLHLMSRQGLPPPPSAPVGARAPGPEAAGLPRKPVSAPPSVLPALPSRVYEQPPASSPRRRASLPSAAAAAAAMCAASDALKLDEPLKKWRPKPAELKRPSTADQVHHWVHNGGMWAPVSKPEAARRRKSMPARRHVQVVPHGGHGVTEGHPNFANLVADDSVGAILSAAERAASAGGVHATSPRPPGLLAAGEWVPLPPARKPRVKRRKRRRPMKVNPLGKALEDAELHHIQGRPWLDAEDRGWSDGDDVEVVTVWSGEELFPESASERPSVSTTDFAEAEDQVTPLSGLHHIRRPSYMSAV